MKRELGPIELVVLQGTPFCNLNCSYCYLSEESRRNKRRMPLTLIDKLFTEVFESCYVGNRMTVTWHAGEPLTLPINYYEEAIHKVLDLKAKLKRADLQLRFDIQSNGSLIDEAWCDFFCRHEELLDIGVSCDGPSNLHDRHRLNWAGKPSFSETVRGMDLLASRGIRYRLIAVVTPDSLEQPEEFVDFFYARKDEISGFHFNFLSEVNSGRSTLQYDNDAIRSHYEFARRMLKELRGRSENGARFKVRNFAQFYAKLFAPEDLRAGNTGGETSFPLRTLNVDVDGNVTTFHAGLYVDVLKDIYGDGFGLGIGNILTNTLAEITSSPKLGRIIADFKASQKACERECEYAPLCSGGYEIAKMKRFGTFEAAETPECRLHVKTLADALLDDLDKFKESALAASEREVRVC